HFNLSEFTYLHTIIFIILDITMYYTLSLLDALPIYCQLTTAIAVAAGLSSETASTRPNAGRTPSAWKKLPVTTSAAIGSSPVRRSEEHTSELQSRENLVCRLLLEKKNNE